MSSLLGLTLLSFFISAILFVPFIDFLYRIKFRRQKQITRDPFNRRTPVFDKLNDWKVGTPFGGGILILTVVTILTLWAYGILNIELKPWEAFVIFFSFISFGALGGYDDFKKIFNTSKNPFFGLRFRHKILIQIGLAFVISIIMYTQLGYFFLNIHGFGAVNIGVLFVPFATFVIVAFANAFNILSVDI